jgi:hypothetical protein
MEKEQAVGRGAHPQDGKVSMRQTNTKESRLSAAAPCY